MRIAVTEVSRFLESDTTIERVDLVCFGDDVLAAGLRLGEFRITGQTWARYEVWKEWAADPENPMVVETP